MHTVHWARTTIWRRRSVEVEKRQIDNDYTPQADGKIERRLDGSLAVRFRERYTAGE
jgi:hypothetical protein